MTQRARYLIQTGLKTLAATSLFLVAACGGAGEEVVLARKHMRRGDLAQAEQALANGEGSTVEHLREEIAEAKVAD